MILVNDPGDGQVAYRQLDHARWNGFTLTDLVFPTFLFVVGCSIVFSTVSRRARGASRKSLAFHILRRSAGLMLIGWFLNLLPDFHFAAMRLYGVLPRIALCYFVAALLFLWVQRPRHLVLIIVALLIGYWAIMRFALVPGAGHPLQDFPLLDRYNNPVAWLDRHVNDFTQRWFHTGSLYEKTRDPEGLLSTMPSIANTLFGMLAALWMRSARTLNSKFFGMLAAGAVLLAAGVLWNPWFPVNKNLWTSSYVLVSTGLALLVLSLLYWIIDIRQAQDHSRLVAALLWPWRIFGSNAITAYTTAVVLENILNVIHMGVLPNGRPLGLGRYIYTNVFARGGSTANTSLIFSLVYVFVCFLPVLLLWRRKIFLKV